MDVESALWIAGLILALIALFAGARWLGRRLTPRPRLAIALVGVAAFGATFILRAIDEPHPVKRWLDVGLGVVITACFAALALLRYRIDLMPPEQRVLEEEREA